MNELALFAGAGGGILGGQLMGWRTICGVERDAHAAGVLAQRQNDGMLEPFPIWSDVTTFDGRPWRGIVDVVSGGFPCQDISVAGNGGGLDGERSGLWSEMARIIREVRPRFVFVENSPALTSRGLGRVLGDLAEMGFNARWGVLGATDVDAPHDRYRIWIVGEIPHSNSVRELQQERMQQNLRGWVSHICPQVPDAMRCGQRGIFQPVGELGGEIKTNSRSNGKTQFVARSRVRIWPAEPDMDRVANGVAHRVDRIRAIGNGQVPRVAATAFEMLSE